MKKTALVAGLVLAGSIAVAPFALATNDDPPTCEQATELVAKAKADLQAALPALLEFDSTDPGSVYPDGLPTLDELPDLLDEILSDPDLGGDARALVQAALELKAKVAAAVVVKDEACDEPDPTPTPTPTPTPPADDEDFDCADFPLEDGRAAQDVLGEDSSDPHNLDFDGDGVACELDDGDLDDDDFDQVDTIPVGSIATGRA